MRLKAPDPTTLSARQKEVFDAIAQGPRAGVRGPLAIWLHRPDLAANAQALGAYCRYGSSLEPLLSELAILITARIWSSEYEWATHKPFAEKAGVSDEIIAAIRHGERPEFSNQRQRAVYDFASELHAKRFVSDETYNAAKEALGEPGVVDLVGILGYYTLISMTINAFEIAPAAGVTPEMMPVEQK